MVNEGQTTSKAWVNTTVKLAKKAFLNGLTVSLNQIQAQGNDRSLYIILEIMITLLIKIIRFSSQERF